MPAIRSRSTWSRCCATGATRWPISAPPPRSRSTTRPSARPWGRRSRRAVPTAVSCWEAAARASRSPPTRSPASGPRSATTSTPPACPASTTTPTCWPWAGGSWPRASRRRSASSGWTPPSKAAATSAASTRSPTSNSACTASTAGWVSHEPAGHRRGRPRGRRRRRRPRGRPRRWTAGSWLSQPAVLAVQALFDVGDLVDAALVAAAFEGGVQPELADLLREARGHDPPAHGQHVGVVVLAGHAGGVEVVAERGPDAGDLVGGDLLALAAASQHDTAVGTALRDRLPHGRADGRVVDRLRGGGAEIGHLVAPAAQHLDQVDLERIAGMVGADGDPHGEVSRADCGSSGRAPTPPTLGSSTGR